MSELGVSELGFFSLLGLMGQGEMFPAAEIRDLTAAANQILVAMEVTAAQLVSIERVVCYFESSCFLWSPIK